MYCYIDNDEAVDMLLDRLKYWTHDLDVIHLFEIYYENMVKSGWWEHEEFDVMSIVDNDYVNWTSVLADDELEENNVDEEQIVAKYNGLNLIVW